MNVDDMELEKIDLASMTIGKAEQLTADALLGGPLDITVKTLRQGATDEQPLEVHYEGGGLPYIPCLSMRRVLIGHWGTQAHKWVGRRMRLFRDAGVSYGGQRVSGIRISHMSHIKEGEPIMLTQGRGKKVPYHVKPLPNEAAAAAGASAHTDSASHWDDEAATTPRQIKGSATLPIEHLRREGLESAQKGSEELKAFWNWLGKDEKIALKPDLDKDWKQIAAKADATLEARKGEFAL